MPASIAWKLLFTYVCGAAAGTACRQSLDRNSVLQDHDMRAVQGRILEVAERHAWLNEAILEKARHFNNSTHNVLVR